MRLKLKGSALKSRKQNSQFKAPGLFSKLMRVRCRFCTCRTRRLANQSTNARDQMKVTRPALPLLGCCLADQAHMDVALPTKHKNKMHKSARPNESDSTGIFTILRGMLSSGSCFRGHCLANQSIKAHSRTTGLATISHGMLSRGSCSHRQRLANQSIQKSHTTKSE